MFVFCSESYFLPSQVLNTTQVCIFKKKSNKNLKTSCTSTFAHQNKTFSKRYEMVPRITKVELWVIWTTI